MSKKTIQYFALMFITLLLIILLTSGCSSSEDEGFAIYLTKDDIPPSQMEILSHVEIADVPVISETDIIGYDAVTHEIQLTEDGSQQISGLGIPVSGKSFVVCVNRSPVYWGSFMAMYSSHMLHGVTILQIKGMDTIRIGTGYPMDGLLTTNDPRNDPLVMQTLKDAGKLVNELPTTFINELPHSMKGYELYSWQDKEEWHFRLITGTNRNKTYEEIVSGDNTLEDLISIHTKGAESIQSVLCKLPENEDITWFGTYNPISGIEDGVIFELPEETLLTSIERYAELCRIALHVTEDR